jgi:hypothetical protein
MWPSAVRRSSGSREVIATQRMPIEMRRRDSGGTVDSFFGSVATHPRGAPAAGVGTVSKGKNCREKIKMVPRRAGAWAESDSRHGLRTESKTKAYGHDIELGAGAKISFACRTPRSR